MTVSRLAVAVACCLLAPALVSAAELSAGAATVEITPPVGFPMWGYAARHDLPAEGTLDPLRARALVLAVGADRIAIVSLDLGRPPTRQTTAAIRTRVKTDAGVGTVFLVASHTHHGPALELENRQVDGKCYVKDLERKLGDVIVAAAKNLRPARIGVASREVALNRNRHSKRADAPVDRELLVLRVEDADGKAIAHLVNFAAHPTMRDAKLLKWSADYPGVMAARVEKETGAPCLFLQGAAGDLSPNPAAGADAEKFGDALAAEVLKLAGTIRCPADGPGSLHTAEEDFTFASRMDHANLLTRTAFSVAFYRELVDFYVDEYRTGVRPNLTVALLGDRLGVVGVSGEFFTGHSLSLKRRARLDHLLFLGYCNDYQQYFPTIEAAAERGYGADPSMAPAEVGAGEKVVDRALIHLLQLQGKLPK
jgi:hypothetical protein